MPVEGVIHDSRLPCFRSLPCQGENEKLPSHPSGPLTRPEPPCWPMDRPLPRLSLREHVMPIISHITDWFCRLGVRKLSSTQQERCNHQPRHVSATLTRRSGSRQRHLRAPLQAAQI
jgi:hypothetical protein